MKKHLLPFMALLLSIGSLQAQHYPYQDPALSAEVRTRDLLSRMTLEEKMDQLNMKGLDDLKMDRKGRITDSSLVALFQGRSIGCLESPFIEHDKIATFSEAADHYLRTRTRLGIPAIQIAECLHGQMALGATIFPQSIGLGSSWNPALIREMAAVIAEEATLSGVDQALSPVFDLARDPRFGRTEECYSEDPYLTREMGKAFVIGMQGEPGQTRTGLAEGKMACTAKHLVANSIPQAGINIAPAHVGERELREVHLVPFQGAVEEANLYCIMPGYHEVDGIPNHGNRWLLDEVLRKEWKFDGYVFADYGAVGMMEWYHHTCKDKEEVAARALQAGVDLEAPRSYAYGGIARMVKEGKLDEALVDRAVSRILRIKFKMGLFDRPFKKEKHLDQKIHKPGSIALAQKIAEESIVLLKNDSHLLPLDRNRIKKIAVIGPNADKVQFGDYSITKNNDYGTTVLQGIRRLAGDDLSVSYTEGCGITGLSEENLDEAARLARESDVTVLVLGGTSIIYSGIGWGDPNSKEINTCGEGLDRSELNFPGIQKKLLDIVTAQGRPTVLVMINGRPYTIPEEIGKVDAAIEAWYPGEKGGEAVSRILFGEVNPSGKLSVTFPQSEGHIPVFANHKPSATGYYRRPGTPEKPGRDYVFSSPDPLFCFGHGLSYTTFGYSGLNIRPQASGDIEVKCRLQNTGSRTGAEVVQLYVRDMVSSVTTPVKALKGFAKIELDPGESREISMLIRKDDLKIWNMDKEYVLEPGEFEVYLGSSSEDIRLKGKFRID